MYKDKKIFAILVNYNGESDSKECIGSLFQAKLGENIQIVIVDNNSPDGSGIRLKKHFESTGNVVVLFNKDNGGFSAGNNIGIKYALNKDADYILLLNNDTVVDADFLVNLFKKISLEEDAKCVYTGKIKYYYTPDVIWFAGGGFNKWKGTAYHYGCNEKDNKWFNRECIIDFATGCFLFMKADAIKDIGYLPEEYFLYSEDLDYSIKIQKVGYQIKYIPSSVIFHKVSASTGKKSELSNYYMYRNRFIVIRKYLKGIQKVSAYVYSCCVCAKAIAKHDVNFPTIKKALFDFINKVYLK